MQKGCASDAHILFYCGKGRGYLLSFQAGTNENSILKARAIRKKLDK